MEELHELLVDEKYFTKELEELEKKMNDLAYQEKVFKVLTRDKIGEAQMTIDKGSLMSILGVPIIRTELMRSVSATGFIAGSGNT